MLGRRKGESVKAQVSKNVAYSGNPGWLRDWGKEEGRKTARGALQGLGGMLVAMGTGRLPMTQT